MRFSILAACLTAATLLAARQPAKAQQSSSPRVLAPGVLKTIQPNHRSEETFTKPRELVEIVHGVSNLDWDPNYLPKSQTLLEKAKQAILRRKIWCLEFSFKPVRMIEVDLPQPSGKMRRKLVWYMVYRVSNRGDHLVPVANQDKHGHEFYDIVSDRPECDFPVRFFPHFVLRSHEYEKEYLEQILPLAIPKIQIREKITEPLYNSVQITQFDIPVSAEGADEGLWGVVTWTDLDPRIDFFSIYVRGLTNAYQFEDPPGAYKAGDSPGAGRKFEYKTLQLNFWRPGDTEDEHEGEIRYGVPTFGSPSEQRENWAYYGQKEPLDHRWVYR